MTEVAPNKPRELILEALCGENPFREALEHFPNAIQGISSLTAEQISQILSGTPEKAADLVIAKITEGTDHLPSEAREICLVKHLQELIIANDFENALSFLTQFYPNLGSLSKGDERSIKQNGDEMKLQEIITTSLAQGGFAKLACAITRLLELRAKKESRAALKIEKGKQEKIARFMELIRGKSVLGAMAVLYGNFPIDRVREEAEFSDGLYQKIARLLGTTENRLSMELDSAIDYRKRLEALVNQRKTRDCRELFELRAPYLRTRTEELVAEEKYAEADNLLRMQLPDENTRDYGEEEKAFFNLAVDAVKAEEAKKASIDWNILEQYLALGQYSMAKSYFEKFYSAFIRKDRDQGRERPLSSPSQQYPPTAEERDILTAPVDVLVEKFLENEPGGFRGIIYRKIQKLLENPVYRTRILAWADRLEGAALTKREEENSCSERINREIQRQTKKATFFKRKKGHLMGDIRKILSLFDPTKAYEFFEAVLEKMTEEEYRLSYNHLYELVVIDLLKITLGEEKIQASSPMEDFIGKTDLVYIDDAGRKVAIDLTTNSGSMKTQIFSNAALTDLDNREEKTVLKYVELPDSNLLAIYTLIHLYLVAQDQPIDPREVEIAAYLTKEKLYEIYCQLTGLESRGVTAKTVDRSRVDLPNAFHELTKDPLWMNKVLGQACMGQNKTAPRPYTENLVASIKN